ncbi:MAG: hypothetical protein QM493_08620 [Sulfurovum sp.]
MKKTILISTLFISFIWGNNTQIAIDNCPIYNNMKHSKNSGNQSLKIGSSYRVIDEKRGQYYISIKGMAVPNRWVDKSCFDKNKPKIEKKVKIVEKKEIVKKEIKTTSKSQNMLLALSWQNAFCESRRYVKECKTHRKRYTDIRFGLHGLWPQPRENIYCGVSRDDKNFDKSSKWNKLQALYLDKSTRKELLEVMPGSASYLHRHEWIKHGTCANMDEDEYYSQAIALTKEFNSAKIGQFFSKNIGKKVTLQQVKFKMNESFGRGAGNKVELRCKKGLITEIWLNLGGGDNMTSRLKSAKSVRSRCKSGIIDRVGF